MPEYVEWTPSYDGDNPPYWEDTMYWGLNPERPTMQNKLPSWIRGTTYTIPEGAVLDRIALDWVVSELRRYTAEELAAYGIVLGEQP
jgi:hypothetical protein